MNCGSEGRHASPAGAGSVCMSCAKTEFLVNMSHELRTPLNAILGFAQILKRDKSLDERNRFAVTTIESSGSHLLALINDMLDLSRIEAGHLELYPSAVELAPFVRSVVDMVRVKADEKNLLEKNLLVATELAHDLPRTVQIDERRLRQVLLNLLGNAIKFTDGGQITLRVRALTSAAQRRLHIEVEDTGVGIAAADLHTIFESYEQVGDPKRRAGGAGLGLAISRALVNALGGEMGVDSTPLVGSRFWFTIDAQAAEAAAPSQSDEREICGYQGRRRKVLIVDDSIERRAMLAAFLQSLAFETTEAANGVEGLLQARRRDPT
jgi:signal transduction histidine kinase